MELLIVTILIVGKIIYDEMESTCPPGMKVDDKQINHDRAFGMSQGQVYKNYRKGKYFK